jgi:copper transport outer membrane protein MctB
MVNFRFHLVSLIAVFLALGLGILTGSAVVNQATVRTIRAEIRQVRAEVNSLRSSNSQLSSDLGHANNFIDDVSSYAVANRLPGVPVTLVAERGMSTDDVKDTADLVRAAGGIAPTVIWLEDRWKVDNDKDLQALRDATGLLGGANSVRSRALDQLAERLTAGATTTPTTDANGQPQKDLLVRLAAAGFISVDGPKAELASFPPGPAHALLMTGTRSTFAGTDVTVEVGDSFVHAGAPTVIGEIFAQQTGKNAPERGAAVDGVRNDSTLRNTVSTVDDLDLAQGRVAAVLALQALSDGTVGHYGYGKGASDPVPPVQPPNQQ